MSDSKSQTHALAMAASMSARGAVRAGPILTRDAIAQYGQVFTPCLEVDRFDGDEQDLRAAGYQGGFPAELGITKIVGPGETIKRDNGGYGWVWQLSLDAEGLAERRAYFDAMDDTPDCRLHASWFTEDRRKFCIATLSEVYRGAKAKRVHAIAESVMRTLIDPSYVIPSSAGGAK